MTHSNDIWWVLAAVCAGTYVCRAAGVKLASHLNPESEVFKWLSCMTYAMVAALTVRLILMPSGSMASVPIWIRVLICAVSLAVMVSRPSKRLVPALVIGTVLMMAYGILS